MSRHDELIAEAFRQIQGEGPPEIGAFVGSWADKLAYRLLDIVGEVALCDLPDGTVKVFQVAEIADVNKVQERAILLLRISFKLQQAEHTRN